MAVEYVPLALLKERALLGNVRLPELDADLHRLIATASNMVRQRTQPFPDAVPSDAVQQVTLMLALNLRAQEIGNYVDAYNRQLPLWTPAMTQILGDEMRDDTPQNLTGGGLPSVGVMTRTTVLPVPTGWPDGTDPGYGGQPVPRWGGRRW